MRYTKGELKIKEYLERNNLKYKPQFVFKDCKYKNVLRYDFAIFDDLNNIKCLIEYDGEQHFYEVYKKREDELFINQVKDSIKNDYCSTNGLDLLRIPYWNFDKIDEILDDYFKFSTIPQILNEQDLNNIYEQTFSCESECQLDEILEEISITDHINEQLKELEEQGLLDYYLYQIEKYNLNYYNENYNLYPEVLSGAYDESISLWEE